MSALVTVTVDGNDLTDFLQEKSLSIKRQSLDATFIDPSDVPLLGDTVVTTDPTWSGTCVMVELVGYRGNVPFYKVRATNADVLPDAGPAPFNLADTGTRYSSPAGYKDLVVTSVLDDAVEEVRSKCIVFKEGLSWGMEIDITSVVAGYTAETFTIMEITYEWPVADAATYTLDLGLGVYADAVEGGPPDDPGTPEDPWLDPPTLDDAIVEVVKDAGCCDDGSGDPFTGGSGIPLDTLASGCDTSPVGHSLTHRNDGAGASVDALGAAGTADDVGSWVYDNVPYTSSDYPCTLGGGSWRGYNDEEIWVEYTAPADDPTTYLGMVTILDCSIFEDGLPQGYEVRWYPGAASASLYGKGTAIQGGAYSGSLTVYVPRNLINWGGTNSMVLHPTWECDRPIQFCNPTADFGSPHVDGRGHSGSYSGFGFDDLCPYGLTTGQTGMAIDVPGIGDTDGVNMEFELLSWTTVGPVTSTWNGLPVPVAEITLDTGASTATFLTPPPANAIVLFTYAAAT